MKIIYGLDCGEILVSDCDWLFLAGYNWYNDISTGYYRCSGGGVWNNKKTDKRPIHSFVEELMGLKKPKGFEIDHIDRDKLNNQRSNLRVASSRLQKYNQGKRKTNTSGFHGVSFFSGDRKKPWGARITLPTIGSKHLGYFLTPEEASEAYQAAKKIRDQEEIERVEKLYS